MGQFIQAFVLILFFGCIMLMMLETGRRIGKNRIKNDPLGSHEGFGSVEAAVLGLMGLIIALTFSGAASRFDNRRMLIVDEANAIGTAYLRVDLLPVDAQPAVRQYFRDYLEARIDVYRFVPDMKAVNEAELRGVILQKKIWKASTEATRLPGNPAPALLLLPALNSMFDICSTRTAIRQIHQPNIIFIVMILQALVCSLIAGFGMAVGKTRSWVHFIGFTVVMIVCIFVIIDLEYPRGGLIRINSIDYILTNLRTFMK